MICHNCYKHGRTKTRCRRNGVCQYCGEDDHTIDKTNKCLDESSRVNGGEGYMAGNNDCEIEKKGNEKMQADSRVWRWRTLKILAGEAASPRSNFQSYPTNFRCKMNLENKIKFNP